MVVGLVSGMDGGVLVDCGGVDDCDELVDVSVARSATLLFWVCTMIGWFDVISVVLSF